MRDQYGYPIRILDNVSPRNYAARRTNRGGSHQREEGEREREREREAQRIVIMVILKTWGSL